MDCIVIDKNFFEFLLKQFHDTQKEAFRQNSQFGSFGFLAFDRTDDIHKGQRLYPISKPISEYVYHTIGRMVSIQIKASC